MRSFDIPFQFESNYIAQIKSIRSKGDQLKRDFTPSKLVFDKTEFHLARHFGFCYGVQNAVEIAYKTLAENPNKKIYLLSEIVHNPEVNNDLKSKGLQFIQNTKGEQLIDWSEITSDDIVLIPAFGTTVEIESILEEKGLKVQAYDTTCPFVEKVWNTAARLAKQGYTIIIHGKYNHEETRATFSHASKYGKAIIVTDLRNTKMLGDFIHKTAADDRDWNVFFRHQASSGFNFREDFDKIAVVNQTTMLASDTKEIADYLKGLMIEKFGGEHIGERFGSTRDTLCYATNDNQNATAQLTNQQLDLAIVVGGYNSSNTKHLKELLDRACPVYFISSERDLTDEKSIVHFDIRQQKRINTYGYLPKKERLRIGLTSGASCPDALMERVFLKLLSFNEELADVDQAINELKKTHNGL